MKSPRKKKNHRSQIRKMIKRSLKHKKLKLRINSKLARRKFKRSRKNLKRKLKNQNRKMKSVKIKKDKRKRREKIKRDQAKSKRIKLRRKMKDPDNKRSATNSHAKIMTRKLHKMASRNNKSRLKSKKIASKEIQ
jgi:hypothetical protein